VPQTGLQTMVSADDHTTGRKLSLEACRLSRPLCHRNLQCLQPCHLSVKLGGAGLDSDPMLVGDAGHDIVMSSGHITVASTHRGDEASCDDFLSVVTRMAPATEGSPPTPPPLRPAPHAFHTHHHARDRRADRKADHARKPCIGQPVQKPAAAAEFIDPVRRQVQAVGDDAAADPDHRRRADDGERAQDVGHGFDEAAAERAEGGEAVLCQMIADIVELHDQRDEAVDADCYRECDEDQRRRLRPDRPARDFGERDRHDLTRQDEIGADRTGDLGLFEQCVIVSAVGIEIFAGVMPGEDMDHLFRAFEAEIGAADHQDRRDEEGRESGQEQGGGKQDQQLVPQAAVIWTK
jgi:hypothetical protein